MSHKLWYISAILNVLLGGKWPETLSSRAWRNRHHWWFRIWYITWCFVFRDQAHCACAYLKWRKRMEEQLGLPFPELVACNNCGLKTYEPVSVVRHVGHSTIQLWFCSKKCSDEYYVTSLRKGGM